MNNPDSVNPVGLPPEEFSQAHLLDWLRSRLGLKTDRALAVRLGVGIPAISKVRHNLTPVTAYMLIAMQEETGLDIRELRALAGDRRKNTLPSSGPAPEFESRRLGTSRTHTGAKRRESNKRRRQPASLSAIL